MSEEKALVPWADDRLGGFDRLGYAALGETFTNLVTSITDTRVISIEAGFGHGKTYFRRNWAEHLRNNDEVVIEIDAMLSDHSGEPVVTILGAMLEQIERTNKGGFAEAVGILQNVGGTFLRATGKALLREGMDELVDGLARISDDKAFNAIIDGVADDLSKAAVAMVSAHMAAERARKDLRTQLENLRVLLTKKKDTKRVIVIVDELDRCHPDYAIALLEAMKVVFNLDGFVFCLMVNAHALEQLADHRFGKHEQGERYLDKFVDMRLRLRPKEDERQIAVENLIFTLPEVSVPFASDEEFGKTRAMEVAKTFLSLESLTMRQLEKVMQRLELAIRMYTTQPIDLPLLVYLGFLSVLEKSVEEMDENEARGTAQKYGLVRAGFVPEYAEFLVSKIPDGPGNRRKRDEASAGLEHALREEMPEMFSKEILFGYKTEKGNTYYAWYALTVLLAPNYIPSHIQMLNAALAISADD